MLPTLKCQLMSDYSELPVARLSKKEEGIERDLLREMDFGEIIDDFASKKAQKSPNIPVRYKCPTNKTPRRNRAFRHQKVPYIVNVQKNEHNECGGIIITSEIILTAAQCFHDENAFYSVLTASMHVGGRTRRNITHKIIYPHFNGDTLTGDLALLIIQPPIDLVHSPNRRIEIYNGILPTKSYVTLSGWGHLYGSGSRLVVSRHLRSIIVPTISVEECRSFYHDVRLITNQEICTFDRGGEKYGSNGDAGGPLVFGGKLVGVYSWGGDGHPRENPDVFMNLLYPLYRNWILANVRLHHGWF
ncbi:trypsin eta-like [Belonocnema kinseyi]|uniref:trypsin eta-like n=1 Tax=Belonocnema kinseyi TaxID=2817044 RepID=UPI00143DABBC|nr:trypsin eta-like [Belonocnema kinseyi]